MSGELIKQMLHEIERKKIQTSPFIVALDEAKAHVQKRRQIRKDDPHLIEEFSDECYDLTMQFYDIVRKRLVAVRSGPLSPKTGDLMTVKEWKEFLILFFYTS